MIPQKRKTFMVTVHHGDPLPTERLLDGVLGATTSPEHVVVVDHGISPFTYSSDRVTVIRPEKNSGYGAGIQTGLGVLISQRVDPQSIVICINNDTTVLPDALQQFQEFLKTYSGEGLIGNHMGSVDLLTGRATLKSGRIHKRFLSIPYIDGAFFAAPLRVLLDLQVPTHYFLYWEDVLLSMRAYRNKIPLLFASLPGFKHIQSSKDSPGKIYYLVRNGGIFLESETSFGWRVYWRVLNNVRRIYHKLKGNKGIAHALADARNRVTGRKV